LTENVVTRRIVVRCNEIIEDSDKISKEEQLYHTFNVTASALYLATGGSSLMTPVIDNFDLNFLVEICVASQELNVPMVRILGNLPALSLQVSSKVV
jgi:hypothetical protein